MVPEKVFHDGNECLIIPSGEGEVMVEMNTAPLIDVMLVLLTLLIITLPIQTHAVAGCYPTDQQSLLRRRSSPLSSCVSISTARSSGTASRSRAGRWTAISCRKRGRNCPCSPKSISIRTYSHAKYGKFRDRAFWMHTNGLESRRSAFPIRHKTVNEVREDRRTGARSRASGTACVKAGCENGALRMSALPCRRFSFNPCRGCRDQCAIYTTSTGRCSRRPAVFKPLQEARVWPQPAITAPRWPGEQGESVVVLTE